MTTNVLVGKKILGINLASDRLSVRFDLEDGETVIADCYGDCCSETWIENIEMPALGFPALVTAMRDLEMPDGGESVYCPHPDCVAYYGMKISTDKGDIIIDYRNNSNGYYGGSLDWSPIR